MKVVALTPEVEEKYYLLFDKVIAGIDKFKADGDTAKFRELLCEIIDETPNVAYLDPDILFASFDMVCDDSQWCEFTEEESQWDKDTLKDLVNDTDEFQSQQLSLCGSCSILITIFGDAYHELTKRIE